MVRNVFSRRRALTRLGTLVLGALFASGCSLGSEPDDRPSSVRVRIEGSSPHPLLLITSTEFFEQLDLETGRRSVVLERSDTSEVPLPLDRTLALDQGSVYVELLNPLVATASVRMRVELDTGQNPYDQSATLSDRAALIYYFLFD